MRRLGLVATLTALGFGAGRLVSGTVKFTATAARATISRGRAVYARGTSTPTGHGRSQLELTDRRPLRAGRYTLTVRARRDGRWTARRQQITIR
ncbi:MAG: hypothetical protein ACRDKL_00315 [Solirubrobacteraceae bacterium]